MADMPAVLVEVGFLSNRAEEKRFRQQAHVRAAAAGIAGGILAYREEHARRLLAER
jgi:N-acetylmuramoyl-L-alanine amidase